jgi:hypothetical protein
MVITNIQRKFLCNTFSKNAFSAQTQSDTKSTGKPNNDEKLVMNKKIGIPQYYKLDFREQDSSFYD